MRTIAEILGLLALLYLLGDRLDKRGHWLGYQLLLVVGVLAWLPVHAWHVVRSAARLVFDGREVRL
jgi:hypothetical protein